MRIILWVTVLAIAAAPGCTFGQADQPTGQEVAEDFRFQLSAVRSLVSAPAHATTREWVIVSATGLGLFAASGFDKDIRSHNAFTDHGWEGTVDDIGHNFQRVELLLGTSALFYIGGMAADRPAWRRTGAELVTAFAVASAGTQLVKFTAGRARPDQNNGPGHFVGPTLDDQFHSLWSGDVTTAFTLASVLSAEAKHPAVTVLLYGLASTTAFQRIHNDRHWFSDVLSAAVWSSAVGIGTVKFSKSSKTENLKSVGISNIKICICGCSI